MKQLQRALALAAALLLLVLCCAAACAEGDVLRLPGGLGTIGEEAFSGDSSLDKVILPEGIGEIGPRAFANSSLTQINLPNSLRGSDAIADSAFDGTEMARVIVPRGSDAAHWAEAHQNALGYEIAYDNELDVWPWDDQGWLYVPQGQSAHIGVNAEAADPEGLSFEWHLSRFDASGEPVLYQLVTGETGPSLTTPAVNERLNYECIVRDAFGFERRTWIDVMVENGLRIWSTLEDGRDWVAVAKKGDTATLSVAASSNNNSALSYRWWRVENGEYGDNRLPIDGATGTSLTTDPVNGYIRYVCRVFDSFGGMSDFWFTLGVNAASDTLSTTAARDVSGTAAWVDLYYSITAETAAGGYRVGVAYSEDENGLTVTDENRFACPDWTWGNESGVWGPANNRSYAGWLDELIPGRTYWYCGCILDNEGHVIFKENVKRQFTTASGSDIQTLTAGGEPVTAPRGNAKTAFRVTAQTAGIYALDADINLDEFSLRRTNGNDGFWENNTDHASFYLDAGETVYLFTRDHEEDAQLSLSYVGALPEADSVSSQDAMKITGSQALIEFSYSISPQSMERGYRVGVAFSRNMADLGYLNDQGRFNCPMWDWGEEAHNAALNESDVRLLDELVPGTTYWYRAYIMVNNSVVAAEAPDENNSFRSFTTADGSDIPALTESVGEDIWRAFPRDNKAAFAFTAESDGIYCVYADRRIDELKALRADGSQLSEDYYNGGVEELYIPVHEGETVYIFARNWNEGAKLAIRWNTNFAEADGISALIADKGDSLGGTWVGLDVSFDVTEKTASQGYYVGVVFSQNWEQMFPESNYNFYNSGWRWDRMYKAASNETVYRHVDQLIPGQQYYCRAFLATDEQLVAYSDIIEFMTQEDDTTPLTLDDWAAFPRGELSVFHFTAEVSGVYQLEFNGYVNDVNGLRTSGRPFLNSGGDMPASRFYADEGETVYFYLHDWDAAPSVMLSFVGAAPETDSLSSSIEQTEQGYRATVTLSVCPETAEREYGFGIEYSDNPSFRDENGNYRSNTFFWQYGNGLVRDEDVFETGVTLLPGVTYYYRAFLEPENSDRIPEGEVHSLTVPENAVPVTDLSFDTWTAIPPWQETVFRFTAEETGFYAVEVDGMYYVGIYSSDGLMERGGNEMEKNDRYAILGLALHEGESCFISVNAPEGAQLRVIDAEGAVFALSKEPCWVWDNHYVSFTAPTSGWYTLRVNRTDLCDGVRVAEGVDETSWFSYYDDMNARSLWMMEGQTFYFITWYDMNRGELLMSVEAVELAEADAISLTGEPTVGDTWAELELCYSITENSVVNSWRGGYEIGIVYSDSEDFGGDEEALVEDWSWERRNIANGETLTRVLDRLAPETTYYYYVYLRDAETGEIFAHTEPDSFRTEAASADMLTLTLGAEPTAVPQGDSVYRFTPDESGMYAIVSRGLGALEIRDSAGGWIAGDASDDGSHEFLFRQGFIGREGETYYIFAYTGYDDLSIEVQTGEEALPVLVEGAGWSDWFDGRQVFRLEVDMPGWYRIEGNGTDRGWVNLPDMETLSWPGYDEDEDSLITAVYLREGTAWVGAWFDNWQARVQYRVTYFDPAEVLSVRTLDAEDVSDLYARFVGEYAMPILEQGQQYRYGILLLRDDGQSFAGGKAWEDVHHENLTVWNQRGPLAEGYRESFDYRPLEPGRRYWYEAYITVYDERTDEETPYYGGLQSLTTDKLHEGREVALAEPEKPLYLPWLEDNDYQLVHFTVPEENAAPLYNLIVPNVSLWVIGEDGVCQWPQQTQDGMYCTILGLGHEGETYSIYLRVWDFNGTTLRLYNGPAATAVTVGANQMLSTAKLYSFTAPQDGEYLIGAMEEGFRVIVYDKYQNGFNHYSDWAWVTDQMNAGESVLFYCERNGSEETLPVTISLNNPHVKTEAALRSAAADAEVISHISPYYEFYVTVDEPITLTQDLELSTPVQLHLNAPLTVNSGVTLTNRCDIYIEEGGALTVNGTLAMRGIEGKWWAYIGVEGGTLTLAENSLDQDAFSIIHLYADEYSNTQAALAALSGLSLERVELVFPVTDAASLAEGLSYADDCLYIDLWLNEGTYSLESFEELDGERAAVIVTDGAAVTVPAEAEVTLNCALVLRGGSLNVAESAVLTLNDELGLNGGSLVNNGDLSFGSDAAIYWNNPTMTVANHGSMTFSEGAAFNLNVNGGVEVDNEGGTAYLNGNIPDGVGFEGGETVWAE